MNTKELIEAILDQPVPSDTTLEELKKYIPKMEIWKQIPGFKPELLDIRFTQHDCDLPGDLTIGDFRDLEDVFIQISTKDGGMKVAEEA